VKQLSIGVTIAAAIALVAGITKGGVDVLGLAADPTLLRIGAVGLALVFTTFRSPLISPFLRVFSTIFAVEYVVTALAYVAVRAGWWPSSFSESAPPASLPNCGDLRTSRLFDLVHRRHPKDYAPRRSVFRDE
jgi:putative ATP-binding cassette transporter